jgi:hypothetical protein
MLQSTTPTAEVARMAVTNLLVEETLFIEGIGDLSHKKKK